MKKLSVVLATRNEENNIGRVLDSIKNIADEIIIFDEYSTDRTVEIAKKYGAKIYEFNHKNNFHETKQAAIEKASGEWILQLDADEVVTPSLAKEIAEVVRMDLKELLSYKVKDKKKAELFMRHQKVIEARDGKIGTSTGEIVAFLIPRLNLFLGKPLIYGGVYPDAAIRLIKNGKAYLPAKSVHEQMAVKGRVGWLENDLEHYDSPTLRRYLERNDRYSTLKARDLKNDNVSRNLLQFLKYTFIKPIFVFLLYYFRYKAILDGVRGFLWSFFSAALYPLAYWKYWNESQD